MADTSVYESARMTHEEIEQYEDALVNTLNNPPKASSHRLQMQWQLAASQLLDEIVSRYESLKDMYDDASGDRRHEWEVLAGETRPDEEDGAMAEFYARLEHLQEYYRKYPERAISLETSATPSILGTHDASLFDMSAMESNFSGEEMGGRFLDLYEQYDMYINLKNVPHISYLEYIARLDEGVGAASSVPAATKRGEAYKVYLGSLCRYLSSFLHKTRPLEDVDAIEQAALDTFEDEWERGAVPGWEAKEEVLYGSKPGNASGGEQGQGIWCDACRRFYAKQTVYDAHLTSARHLKAVKRMESGEPAPTPAPEAQSRDAEVEQRKRELRAKQIARDEVLARSLADELTHVRDETRANVERKASLTEREREEEAEALDAEMDEAIETGGLGYEDVPEDGEGGSGAHGGEKMHNPLKLPLGWDGKPIPFWMYKLHGLRVEYKCEICSDYVYKGRKVFEKHFSESRHAFGMRALGLPNTPQFRDVTRIQDALALAEKLRQQKRVENVEEDDTIEVEDEHGNVCTHHMTNSRRHIPAKLTTCSSGKACFKLARSPCDRCGGVFADVHRIIIAKIAFPSPLSGGAFGSPYVSCRLDHVGWCVVRYELAAAKLDAFFRRCAAEFWLQVKAKQQEARAEPEPRTSAHTHEYTVALTPPSSWHSRCHRVLHLLRHRAEHGGMTGIVRSIVSVRIAMTTLTTRLREYAVPICDGAHIPQCAAHG